MSAPVDTEILHFIRPLLSRARISDLVLRFEIRELAVRIFVRERGSLTAVDVPSALATVWARWLDFFLPSRPQCWAATEFEDFSAIVDERGKKEWRFRASLSRNIDGDELVLRVLPERVPTPEELLIPPAVVERFIKAENGLFVFVGGTNNGKTTTMTSLVRARCLARMQKVITIEDPVEFVLGDIKGSVISQRQVGMHTQSFSAGLKAAMRMSPDVIVVGEVREGESAIISASAALSGHVVACTMHGDFAAFAAQRLLMFMTNGNAEEGAETGAALEMIASSLRGVIAQRLIRVDGDHPLVPIHECLFATLGVANKIRRRDFKSIRQDIETGRSKGMQTFQESIDRRIAEGLLPRGFDLGISG
jgi:twitching motility protein PilT